jgi:hypothetical protein
VRDVLRRRPAAQQTGGRPAVAERGRVALEHLRVLAELLADQPLQVRDGALLAARQAVSVVQQQDHGAREPRARERPGGVATRPLA